MTAPPIPQVTLEQFEQDYRDFHRIPAALDHWASSKPDDAAILNATRGTSLTWAALAEGSRMLAGELKRMGLRKGDFLAASLPLLDAHILLEYACFRLGVIHAPLDLRLQPAEVIRSIRMIGARAYAFFGKTPALDLTPLADEVRRQCPSVEFLIQFAAGEPILPGAASFQDILSRAMSTRSEVVCDAGETDGAQVIFTTGSTGSPKPALLTHRSITCQNLCLGTGFHFGPGQRVLCNLPASHVGGQSEVLLSSLYMGGETVTLEVFDPVKSLDAIERYGVTLVGQIPAMFQLEWRTSGYERRNLASLRNAVYGGQAVPRPFLDQMLKMATTIGTGLGLTEASGFCTYTPMTSDAGEVADGIGWAMPAYPMAIREAMGEDGAAGRELAAGEIGHVCFRGPQNFAGYVNDPAATACVISRDGWLYTGDMGFLGPQGLHFSGRAGWMLKPAGYRVFPSDIENHLCALGQVGSAGVVGHEHSIWGEGIIAYVEKRPGTGLGHADLKRHARALTSYMRPLHYVILEPGSMPLNRTAKVDVTRLRELAKDEVQRLRARGRWDRSSGVSEAES
jgi:acyl-CoA synthetase (AMP-forming)/AMP-acid ligase II